MIDWSKYDSWKLESPEESKEKTCITCFDKPKHNEDYCKLCISLHECHRCGEILPDENNWNEIKPAYFVCTQCYEKIIGG